MSDGTQPLYRSKDWRAKELKKTKKKEEKAEKDKVVALELA